MALRDDILQKVTGYPQQINLTSFPDWQGNGNPQFRAQTACTIHPTIGRAALVGNVYKLTNVGVTVSLNRRQCWVDRNWWNSASTADQTTLTIHEQGHMDITGFIAWEMCRQLLLLEVVQHPIQDRPRDLQTGTRMLQRASRDVINGIDILRTQLDNTYFQGFETPGIYETETQHGNNLGNQRRWTAMFAGGLRNPVISFQELLRNNGIRV